MCCGLLIGFILCYLFLQPKLNNIKIQNRKIIEENNEQIHINDMLKEVENDLHIRIDKLKDEEIVAMDRLRSVESAYKETQSKRNEVLESMKILQEQAESSSQIIYEKNF